ncbi:ankyrin repeat domain-containing protein [uncultured Kordia sp.]|uniref:ankyrin repeat domain-containing protein n=1 Tax=uncultured Kordia sp. TaxID=507699 RepID=UPI002637867E|nr:ankyrin repeat domain-containing protein [uncultured Kordia sp.]
MKKYHIYSIIILFTLTICAAQENVNTHNENGKTPLITAVSENNVEKVKQLIQKGANINLHETTGLQGTALMYASSIGNIEICKLLLENGAKINAIDKNNDHALNWAAFSGKIPVMKLLIEKKADLFLKSKHGTAVDVAFRLWHHDSVSNVFKSTKIARLTTKKEQKLITAILENDINSTKKLLKKGISANTKDPLETPILQLAAQQGNYELVKLLIEHKTNLNAMNRVGQTPLAWAARFGHIAIVDLLLKSGADPNSAGKIYQLTPLIGAAVNGNITIGSLLIENNASIDTKDRINNASALHWALWYKHKDFAKLLLTHNADYTYKALDNRYSAFDVAKFYNLKEIIQLIKHKQQEKNPLVGSWKIKEIHYIYTDTTYIRKEEDHGRFIFSSKNYALMYNPQMQKRTPFQNLSKPVTEEIIKAFQSIVFNTGSYQIDKKVISTISDIAKVPGFERGKQYYRVAFNNDFLELIMFDETYPNGNKPTWFGKLKVKFILKKE